MLRRPIAVLGAGLLALVLGACGGGGTDTNASLATSTGTQPAAAAYPVTVEADNGPVVLESRPTRIVSLSSTATESLFAIGADDQVIAVDEQSNFPEEAPVTDLSGFQPNLEAIAGYEPDLVVAAYDPGGLVNGLGRLKIPVLLQDAAADLDAAYAQIETLGAATGHAEEARELTEEMEAEIEELLASASGAA